MQHTLPPEILRQVFTWACADRPTIVSLIRVCKLARDWNLPLLYRSITFLNASEVSHFCATHDPSDIDGRNRLSLVRKVWFGDSGLVQGDLQYGSSSWPLTFVHRILWLCNNLHTLVIINLDQNLWTHIEGAIPASLEDLVMGPVHGPFFIKSLTRKPRIKRFTSAQTFMRDDEVVDVVLSPHLRRFRRISEIGPGKVTPFWMVEQAECITKSETLEKMEILLCGISELGEPMLKELQAKLPKITHDERVTIRWGQPPTWIELLRLEFEGEEQSHLASLCQA
ncbi:hypothetical protein BDZ94DRAFT_1247549 [Collybia nuda]|uniref:Uncharacterized protein n=1 Tax=Collybia nuda TaxID=64659 RepID=A0A9P5YCW1_9AGAR|nr:hypothetical protein BDZ94DRAFT_1247549 [Collybia nuda]